VLETYGESEGFIEGSMEYLIDGRGVGISVTGFRGVTINENDKSLGLREGLWVDHFKYDGGCDDPHIPHVLGHFTRTII
jgi:hypothetical protein